MSNTFTTKLWTIVLLLALWTGGSKVRAQQDKMFSQYMFNMLALNPAYAGSRDVLSATAMFRSQWVGLEGAPQTGTFTIDMPLNRERVGIGLQLYNDRIGLFNETGAVASYAFRIKMGNRTTLALGLQGGVTNLMARLTEVQLIPAGVSADPAFAQNINKMLPNFGTGIYLSNDRLYLSLSVPRLVKNRLTDYDSGTNRAVVRRHAYAAGGFVVGLSPALKLKPSFLVKYAEGAPLGFDGNVNLWLNDRVALGVSLRKNQFYSFTQYTNDALVGMVELQMSDQFRLGYAYDRTISRLGQVAPSSHEIMLRYEFGFGKSKILTPRYF